MRGKCCTFVGQQIASIRAGRALEQSRQRDTNDVSGAAIFANTLSAPVGEANHVNKTNGVAKGSASMPKTFLEDGFRRSVSAPANALIDGYSAGRIDRRTFLRQGSIFGLSFAAMGLIGAGADAQDSPVAVKKGGTLRIGVSAPTGPADPMVAANQGSIAMYQPVGEYLIRAEPDLSLRPFLATDWSANDDGTVWTFNLRQDVTFQDGQPMKAADVVATFNRLANPEGGSIALSAFRGIINEKSATAIDDYT
ncbi:hypothetical protein EON80_30275, partial [bacterium]